ncbi:hypothetical protein [Nocardia carnea]|uniref:hypothetical protein n=1 Tax=Nocardia carnea TaxID=37328 RepID=UPI0024548D21|nr:hypothetical protein [Nocardia carnea]
MPECEPITTQGRAMRQYLEQQYAAGRIGDEELSEGRRRLALLARYEHQEHVRNPLETPAERQLRAEVERRARLTPGVYGPLRNQLEAQRAAREHELFRRALDRTNSDLRNQLRREYHEQEYQQWCASLDRTVRDAQSFRDGVARDAQATRERIAREVQSFRERIARDAQATRERAARRDRAHVRSGRERGVALER